MVAGAEAQVHPYEVVEGGLRGVGTALKRLRVGRSSATKSVVRIQNTPNLKREKEKS
jgi:NADPH:quinone reductase